MDNLGWKVKSIMDNIQKNGTRSGAAIRKIGGISLKFVFVSVTVVLLGLLFWVGCFLRNLFLKNKDDEVYGI